MQMGYSTMYTFQRNKLLGDLEKSDLDNYEKFKKDYSEKSTKKESESIDDLIKHLWIVNGASSTISIGMIQSKGVTDSFQFWATFSFVFGLIVLLIFKFISEFIASRDRYRFYKIIQEIENERIEVDAITTIRDRFSNVCRNILICIRVISGACFIAGLSMMLYAFRGYAFL